MPPWTVLRRLAGHDDRRAAFTREGDVVRAAVDLPTLPPAFVADARRRAGEGGALLGRTALAPGLPVAVSVDRDLADNRHTLVVGSTGTGKSFTTLLAIEALLRRQIDDPRAPCVFVLDHKGELVDLVRGLVSRLLASPEGPRFRALLDGLAVVDPFSETALPPFQLLAPQRGVPPEVQAYEFVSVLNRMGSVDLGHLQDDVANHLALLGVLTGRHVPALRDLLNDPPALARAAVACGDPGVAAFFREVERRPPTALAGVRSRLNRLLRLPATREMLSATGTISFPELLRTRLVLVNLGSPPMGCEDIARFWSGLVTLRLARAIFARTAAQAERRAVVFIDEWQEGLLAGPDAAQQYARLLAQARSKGVSFHLISQSLAGAAEVSATLPRVVATNTATQWIFRMSPEDARAMAHVVTVTGRRPRPAPLPWEDARAGGPFLGPTEERAELLGELSRLPDRTFYLWNQRAPWPAVLVQTRDVDARPRTLSPREAGLLRDGVRSVPLREPERPGEHVFVPVGVRTGAAAPAAPAPPTVAPRPRRRRGVPRTE